MNIITYKKKNKNSSINNFNKMTNNLDKTPGLNAKNVMETIKNEIIFKKPIGTPRKRIKEKILEEETYVEKISNIIQRDFFPDLEKLKAQNEYLDAEQRNDVIKMRELYMKYSGKKTPINRLPSPATFETPANIHNSQIDDNSKKLIEKSNKEIIPKLSLDQFLNSHTSQDNQSFSEILLESDKKHKEKYSYLYNEETKCDIDKNKQLELPSIEQQCQLQLKPLTVDTWNYKNKNYIMYTPDGVELTSDDIIELNKKRQEINHSNTRLINNPFNENQSKETINELAKNQSKILDGKIGVDGKELLNNIPNICGYTFLQTPSPSPNLLNTPLMTWGEIEGTPFLLDGNNTPRNILTTTPKHCGPSFKMSEPPRREQLAMALAEKVCEKKRDKKKNAIDVARKQLTSPSPKIDRLSTISPVLKRINSGGIKLNFYSELRNSYSPSPGKRKSTPIINTTPKGTQIVTTPKLNLGIKKATTSTNSDDHLTDNLLKIDLPKRNKASDFF